MSAVARETLLDAPRRIHLMGIGGAGMSALAEWLTGRGHAVSGCDARASAVTDRLASLGIEIHVGHDPSHVADVDALVYSSAIPSDDPERRSAGATGALVIRRAELLGAVMERSDGVAVAGTHGKSTTTTMTGAVLEAAGWDPTVIVGGRIRGREGNLRLGGGGWLVAEADEYDRSFLALAPRHAVINNVEADHLDVYGTLEDVRESFSRFAERIASGGTLALGIDDPGARTLRLPEDVRVTPFGISDLAEVSASEIEPRPGAVAFRLRLGHADAGPVALAMPGLHNVRNALAAAAIGWRLEVPPEAIRAGLEAVRGVERRFEILRAGEDLVVVDDYAHHPTEIAATLECARGSWPGRRLLAVFQPHLYSRTRDFAARFGDSLAAADVAFVTDVYPAREAPIEGVSGRLVADATASAGGRATYLPQTNGSMEETVAAIAGELQPGDVVVTLGAGDVDRVARALLARWGER